MQVKEIKIINDNIKNELIKLVIECVASGDLGFAHPLSNESASQYWNKIGNELMEQSNKPNDEQSRVLLIAYIDNQIAGTCQIAFNPKYYTNCNHRAEVQKLMVSSSFRGRGVAKMLLESIEKVAQSHHIQLLILDTRSDLSVGEMYKKMGYVAVGDIPFYSLENNIYTSTTYFYKIIDNNLISSSHNNNNHKQQQQA